MMLKLRVSIEINLEAIWMIALELAVQLKFVISDLLRSLATLLFHIIQPSSPSYLLSQTNKSKYLLH
jgi:hypothetical protein